jgi:GNAT superfamily N-acetyltransferase
MADAGLGAWFGAFVEGRLVADRGVFVEGGVARFQAVETHPEFRRRGICATLVHESARHALATLGAERLVMVADAHYHAGRIYESLGFRPTERQLGMELRPARLTLSRARSPGSWAMRVKTWAAPAARRASGADMAA